MTRLALVSLLLLCIGSGTTAQTQPAIVPYKIHVPDEVLRDLKERLTRTRFPDEIEGSGWEYGADLRYMKDLVAYWRDQFDWRKQERALNAFDQYTTTIDGLAIHFIHQRSPNPNAMPLVIQQGFPSSISEFMKVIGPLTDPVRYGGRASDAFHVVTISLPGIGFSERPHTRGFNLEKDAAIIATLMARLGYSRYAVQGGDVGAGIGRFLALNDTSHVVGLHLNYCNAPPPPGATTAGLSAAEQQRIEEREVFWENEHTGWIAIQQRRPQTLAFAFNDSPVGQAAWLVDKWRVLSDSNGNLDTRFTKDEILTNVTIYWATQTSGSAGRRYREGRLSSTARGLNVGKPAPSDDTRRVEVPTACALFPREATLPPRQWFEARYNLRRWTEMPRGGHFPPLEEPGLYVDDVRAFFRELR
jgi:microsomal epoxide hydrolase